MAVFSLYGTGLAFPFQLDATKGRPLLASEETLVKMSMRQLLLTNRGERPFLVRNGVPYGTRLRQVLFSDKDTAAQILVYDTRECLDTWEPRIVVTSVDAHAQTNSDGSYTLYGSTHFRYRSTNRPDNFVLPYRLQPVGSTTLWPRVTQIVRSSPSRL